MKLALMIVFVSMLAACGKGDGGNSAMASKSSLEVKSPQDFEVCVDKTCISEFTPLTELYAGNGVDSIGSFGVMPGLGAFSIVKSIKYNDGKDWYAIFITQANIFQGGGLSTCHACGAVLGIAIYQKHNQWKLFAKSNRLKTIGSYGRILGYPVADAVEISSGGAEKFIIALKSSDGGMGYTSGLLTLIGVSPVGVNQYESPIRYLGSITTSNSDCGTSAPQGDDWVGSWTYDWSESPPNINLTKKFRKNCTDEVIKDSQLTIRYKYDGMANNYIAEKK